MNCFNYFTETWSKTALSIAILIALTFFVYFSIKLLINIFKQKIPFVSSIVLISLACFSKSEWCYLAVIIIIAYKGKLIDEKMESFVLKICNIFGKNPKDISSIISTKEKVSQELKADLKKIDNNLIIKSMQSHKNVINWFKKEQGIIFEQEKDLTYKNLERIPVDGFCKTKCRDYILEIKRGFNNHNLCSIIENGFNALKRCEKYYDDSDKVVDLYLAVVFDDNLNIDYNQIKTFLRSKKFPKKYNYTVSIFKEGENNNLTLVDGVIYLKTDVYEFKCKEELVNL